MRTIRNFIYIMLGFMVVLLLVPAVSANEKMGYSQTNKVYSTNKVYTTVSPTMRVKVAPVGSGNVTDTRQKTTYTSTSTYDRPVSSALAYTSYPGKCRAAFAGAGQFEVFGISFSGSRGVKKCEEQELAILMIQHGSATDQENGRQIFRWHFADVVARRESEATTYKWICNPRKPNCTRIAPITAGEPES